MKLPWQDSVSLVICILAFATSAYNAKLFGDGICDGCIIPAGIFALIGIMFGLVPFFRSKS
jgi:hypothetical protein